MFDPENDRRLAVQLFIVIVAWSLSAVVVCVQYPRLLTDPATGQPRDYNPAYGNPFYDPWRDDPWEFNLADSHHSILEATVTLLAWFYGILHLSNVFLIILEDDREAAWTRFWSLCEDLNP